MKLRAFGHLAATGLVAFLAAILALTTAASAQRFPDDRGSRQQQRNTAGDFDYYVLALSWSPTHCASQREGYDAQCDRRDGKRYSFVLHGLWPQFAPKGWPEYCPTRKKPFVPRDVADRMLDIMPSDKLVFHSFRKHGTCSGLEPAPYFSFSRQLFSQIRIPERFQNPFEAQFVTVEDTAQEFMRANAWLKPDMFAVQCGGAGNRLREIRFCFNREGQPRACGNNEDQRRMCSASKMYVPPVRATKPDAPAREPNAPPARPTVIPNARNI